jgi:osmotically inducible protein OsmC
MNQITKTLHTGKTKTTGGRDSGASRSSDGLLDIRLSNPGSARIGTNPEQLFAAGWSASFADAIAIAARNRKIMLGAKVSVEAEVDLNLGEDGYSLSSRLTVTIQGLDRVIAKTLIDEAEKICPYSKATRSNVEVTIELI